MATPQLISWWDHQENNPASSFPAHSPVAHIRNLESQAQAIHLRSPRSDTPPHVPERIQAEIRELCVQAQALALENNLILEMDWVPRADPKSDVPPRFYWVEYSSIPASTLLYKLQRLALQLSESDRRKLVGFVKDSLQEGKPPKTKQAPSEHRCTVWHEVNYRTKGESEYAEYWLHWELPNDAIDCGREHRSKYICQHPRLSKPKGLTESRILKLKDMVAQGRSPAEILEALGKKEGKPKKQT